MDAVVVTVDMVLLSYTSLLPPLRPDPTSAPRFASTIAQINANPSMTDRQKAELCIKAVCDQIDYVVDGGASWGNGKNGGDCESYARMLNQILAAAGLPNMRSCTNRLKPF